MTSANSAARLIGTGFSTAALLSRRPRTTRTAPAVRGTHEGPVILPIPAASSSAPSGSTHRIGVPDAARYRAQSLAAIAAKQDDSGAFEAANTAYEAEFPEEIPPAGGGSRRGRGPRRRDRAAENRAKGRALRRARHEAHGSRTPRRAGAGGESRQARDD